jgi:hypothetical protein
MDWTVSIHLPPLFGRLARVLTKKEKRVYQNFQIKYYRIIKLELTFSNSPSFGQSMAHEV